LPANNEGRDVSQCFTTAESAEAGLFQTSFGARRFSASLDGLFTSYQADQSGCRLDEFKGALSCRIRTSHNPACPGATGDVAGAAPGADWQRLSKSRTTCASTPRLARRSEAQRIGRRPRPRAGEAVSLSA